MKNISKERLLEIRIPRPSIEEQKFIVKAISDIEALIYDLEKLIKKNKTFLLGQCKVCSLEKYVYQILYGRNM